MYFVPGGRIGFLRHPDLHFPFNAWIASSQDHTLRVHVTERIRLSAYFDADLWDKDDRWRRIHETFDLPGYEVRRFKDLRYGDGRNYVAEALVARDDVWMGQIELSTGDHGGLVNHAEGQAARWSSVMQAVLSSMRVRDQLSIEAALGELKIKADLAVLHPRLVGETLILSLDAPRTPLDSWAANTPNIRLSHLPNLYAFEGMAGKAAARTSIDEAFAQDRQIKGSTVIQGRHCRGVLRQETNFGIPNLFATGINAYGSTRQQELVAMYSSAARKPLLDALHRVFQSLELGEWT